MGVIVYPKGTGIKPVRELPWPTRKVRVAIIGASFDAFICHEHLTALRALSNLCRIVAAAPSRNKEKCRIFGNVFGLPEERTYTKWQEMLDREQGREDRPDIILICTETDAHAEMIIGAFQHGFDVGVDKPTTVTLQEMIAVEEEALSLGRLLFTTWNHLMYSACIYAKQLVAEGAIGIPHTLRGGFSQS